MFLGLYIKEPRDESNVKFEKYNNILYYVGDKYINYTYIQ